jgi:hypothetical protein
VTGVAAAVAAIALFAAACGARGGGRGGDGPGRDDGVVYVTSDVADAQVIVDGHYVAPVGALRAGVALPPGPHRIEVRRDDYFARYFELTIAPAERRPLRAELVPILP